MKLFSKYLCTYYIHIKQHLVLVSPFSLLGIFLVRGRHPPPVSQREASSRPCDASGLRMSSSPPCNQLYYLGIVICHLHLLGSQSCSSPRSTSATKLPLLTLGGGKLCCWTRRPSLKLLSTAAPSISEHERQNERLTWKGS